MSPPSVLAAVLTVLALASDGAARAVAPTVSPRGGITFALDQTRTGPTPAVERRGLTGPIRIPMTATHNTQVEGDLAKRQESHQDLALLPGSIAYTVDLQVGTPPKRFPLAVDTGSSTMVVVDTKCFSWQCPPGTALYDDAQSTTSQPHKSAAKPLIKYVIGHAAGRWVEDTVAMGPLTVNNQVFIAASDANGYPLGPTMSGILGMGPKPKGEGDESTWITTMAQTWEDKRFGLHFAPRNLDVDPPIDFSSPTFDKSVYKTGGGHMTLGGVAEEMLGAPITYVPLASAPWWMANINGVKLNGNALPVTQTRTIFDTAQTLSGLSREVGIPLFSQIPGSRLTLDLGLPVWLIPCNTDAKISFVIGDQEFEIFRDDLLFEIYNATEGMCVSGFYLNSSPSYDFSLGLSFLRNVYSVFRFDPPAVGVAPLNVKRSLYTGWPKPQVGNEPVTAPPETPATNTTTSSPTPTAEAKAEPTGDKDDTKNPTTENTSGPSESGSGSTGSSGSPSSGQGSSSSSSSDQESSSSSSSDQESSSSGSSGQGSSSPSTPAPKVDDEEPDKLPVDVLNTAAGGGNPVEGNGKDTEHQSDDKEDDQKDDEDKAEAEDKDEDKDKDKDNGDDNNQDNDEEQEVVPPPKCAAKARPKRRAAGKRSKK